MLPAKPKTRKKEASLRTQVTRALPVVTYQVKLNRVLLRQEFEADVCRVTFLFQDGARFSAVLGAYELEELRAAVASRSNWSSPSFGMLFQRRRMCWILMDEVQVEHVLTAFLPTRLIPYNPMPDTDGMKPPPDTAIPDLLRIALPVTNEWHRKMAAVSSWTPDMIKEALKDRGISQAALARILGRGAPIVWATINGLGRSESVELALAALLGVERTRLFGERANRKAG